MISKHFTINELVASRIAQKYSIKNIPTKNIRDNLVILATELLDPIREFLERPLRINSGFRSKELNAKVGGTNNSVHTIGCAADLVIPTEKEMDRVLEFLKKGELPFDQAIKYPTRGFVHVALSPAGKNRRQIMSSPSKNKYILLS